MTGRRHTANAKRDLPGLVAELVEPLTEQREAQFKTFERYRQVALTDQTADHAIMQMYRGRHHQRATHRRRGAGMAGAILLLRGICPALKLGSSSTPSRSR